MSMILPGCRRGTSFSANPGEVHIHSILACVQVPVDASSRTLHRTTRQQPCTSFASPKQYRRTKTAWVTRDDRRHRPHKHTLQAHLDDAAAGRRHTRTVRRLCLWRDDMRRLGMISADMVFACSWPRAVIPSQPAEQGREMSHWDGQHCALCMYNNTVLFENFKLTPVHITVTAVPVPVAPSKEPESLLQASDSGTVTVTPVPSSQSPMRQPELARGTAPVAVTRTRQSTSGRRKLPVDRSIVHAAACEHEPQSACGRL